MGNTKEKPIHKKWWFWVITIIVIGAISSNFTGGDEQQITNSQTEEKLSEQQQATIDSLNDFSAFIENYKQLEEEKTTTWDKYLYGETVTWTGTVMDVSTKQIYIWGKDYNNQTWDTLSQEDHEKYNVFIAKFENEVPSDINTGDDITVKGILESRGDYESNTNWKLYESKVQ